MAYFTHPLTFVDTDATPCSMKRVLVELSAQLACPKTTMQDVARGFGNLLTQFESCFAPHPDSEPCECQEFPQEVRDLAQALEKILRGFIRGGQKDWSQQARRLLDAEALRFGIVLPG